MADVTGGRSTPAKTISINAVELWEHYQGCPLGDGRRLDTTVEFDGLRQIAAEVMRVQELGDQRVAAGDLQDAADFYIRSEALKWALGVLGWPQ